MRVTNTWTAVAFACALVAGACGRAEVPDPTERTEQALREANLGDVTIDWDRDARVAHLEGSVATEDDRVRAGDVASSAIGTAGTVLNDVKIASEAVGTAGRDSAADEADVRVRAALDEQIDKDPSLRDRDVDFVVTRGLVTVKGEVRSAAEKARVTDIVKGTPGVRDVTNALDIEPPR